MVPLKPGIPPLYVVQHPVAPYQLPLVAFACLRYVLLSGVVPLVYLYIPA